MRQLKQTHLQFSFFTKQKLSMGIFFAQHFIIFCKGIKLETWPIFYPARTMVLYMSFDRFLLAVESRDLSQPDKILIRVSFFPKMSDGYFWMIKFAVIPKKNYLALGNLAKFMFWSILSFKNFQDRKVNIFLSFSGER